MKAAMRWVPLVLILLLAAAALYVVWPQNANGVLPRGVTWPSGHGIAIGSFERREMRLGLDLQGGTRLLLRADVPQDFSGNVAEAVNGTIRVLQIGRAHV